MNPTKFRQLIATVLLWSQITPSVLAAIPSLPQTLTPSTNTASSRLTPPPLAADRQQSMSLSSSQLGLLGPLNARIDYSSLTGTYVTGEFLKKINDKMGVNLIGEYGAKQYRLNGTFGWLLNAKTFLKITAEQFAQKLPFVFTTGNTEQKIKQNAVGANLNHHLEFANLSLGAYVAQADSKRLASTTFISNGSNCHGFEAGLTCIDERNIAGGKSSGANLGMGALINPATYLEGKVYYDAVHYRTIFTAHSDRDRDGLGAGIYAQRLLAANLKLQAGIEARKIYNTYDVALYWKPTWGKFSETEWSIHAQHVKSMNPTPDNTSVGVQVSFYADKLIYNTPHYSLSHALPVVDGIASWIRQPAVKMNQVLAIAEEYVHLADTKINAISPSFGPLAGGNTVTIFGTNFPLNSMVRFGNNIATIVAMTTSSITVTVPAGNELGGVSVSITTPENKTTQLDNAYLYTNGAVPIVTGSTPSLGPTIGGIRITLTGANFVPGATTVIIGGIVIPPSDVTVTTNDNTFARSIIATSPVSLSFIAPPHPKGTVVVSVATPAGSSRTFSSRFTYVPPPTIESILPNSGALAGGTVVTLIGDDFIANRTSVKIGDIVIPPSSVQVISPTQLSFVTPAQSAGDVKITVLTPGGVSDNTSETSFIYTNNAPTVGVLNPNTGPSSGGLTVNLTGSNFVPGNTSITMGNVLIPASVVQVTSANSLSFDPPPRAPGKVPLFVTTPVGNSGLVADGYTYVASPAVGTLTPAEVNSQGGTVVTLSGSGFVIGGTQVLVDGVMVNAADVTVNSADSLSFIAPSHGAGNVAVSVSTAGGVSGNVSGGLTYVNAPVLTNLTPNSGPVAGGTQVTVNGSNFVAGNTRVTFGDVVVDASAVTVVSANQLTLQTPAQAAGTVAVKVSTYGISSNTISNGFTYQDPLSVTAINPSTGPATGGTTVTITGTNFIENDTTVLVGMLPATTVTVNSSTSLTFVTPAQLPGSFSVTVSNTDGSSVVVQDGFNYTPTYVTADSITPASGATQGGDVVSITGSNFVAQNTSVHIGNITIPSAEVNVQSTTLLTFTTPAYTAGQVDVYVTTPSGNSNLIVGGFTYNGSPTATGLSPATGPVAGGTVVTVSGSNFVAGNTSVSIDGQQVAATVNSPDSLSFTTPATQTAGSKTVTVTTAGGSAVVAGGFTYVAAPTATGLSPTSGSTAGGTEVSVSGSNFVVGNTIVNIGGTQVTATVNSTTNLSFITPAETAGNKTVTVSTLGGTSAAIAGGYTYLAPSLASCSAALPSLGGIQLVTCLGVNLTLFRTTYIKASGSAACSTFPTQSIVPSINILGQVIITAINIPSSLVRGLVGCQIELCSNSSCSVLGGVAGPVIVTA